MDDKGGGKEVMGNVDKEERDRQNMHFNNSHLW